MANNTENFQSQLVQGQITLRLPAIQLSLVRIAEAIAQMSEEESWPDDVRFHVDLVLEELVQNIVSYGYADGRSGQIEISVRQLDGALAILIEDDADPFDPFSLDEPDINAPLHERPIGGLGVHFARTFMDRCSYQRVSGHNRVELTKSLRSDEPGH